MAKRCNPCDPTYVPGGECDIYTSQVTYDGSSIPEGDIRHGDNLNDVIESLVRKLAAVSNATASIQKERFQGVTAVKLRYDPLMILSVTYGGVHVPNDGFVVNGRNIKFRKKYCLGDEFTDVNVVYTTLNSNILSSACYG